MRVLVCSSGGGSNFESLVVKSEVYRSYRICKLIVDRKCGAIEIAKRLGVQTELLSQSSSIEDQLLSHFNGFDLIVLAGFMPIVSARVIESVSGMIINTHPSLLPKHGGRGMYGVRVQESVLNSLDSTAGCTVHQVNSEIDGGLVLAQSKMMTPEGITAWSLGGLVHELERELLPLTVHRLAIGEITLAI
jgi:phosphoribosylglycinamide formyltransferase-1